MKRSKKNLILKRTAVTGAIVAAMAAPLIVMPVRANADLASAVESGSYGPVVTIVSPQYADVVKGTSVSIDVAVQQRTNPVRALQMFVDDHIATPGWVPLKSLQSSKFNWDTTLFSNGPHKLTVRVLDTQGLIGQAEITIYVNNAAQSQQQNASNPALKWLGIQNGQILKGVVNLELQASGNFGVKYIFVMLNPVTNPDQKPALRSWMINQPPYIIPFDTTKVNDGAYVLDALAYDALSNQGEAPRINIGIANNSINPTYIGTNQPSTPTTTDKTDDGDSKNTTDTTDTTNTGSPETSDLTTPQTPAVPVTPPTTVANANIANTQTVVPFSLPAVPVAPTLVPQSPREGALNDGEGSSTGYGSGAMVEVKSSLQVSSQSAPAAPRVTALPMLLASNDISPQPQKTPSSPAPATSPTATIAQSPLFASLGDDSSNSTASVANDQPLATIAPLHLSALPNAVKAQEAVQPNSPTKSAVSTPTEQPLATIADLQLSGLSNAADVRENKLQPKAPVREAKLPTQPVDNTALKNTMRQLKPLSTIVSMQTPDSELTQSKFDQTVSKRYFQINDAMSMPIKEKFVAPAVAKTPAVPVFPQALLNTRTAKVEDVPSKSTFSAPSVGMTDVTLASRMTPATSLRHNAPRLIADAQIGALPESVVHKAVAAPRHVVSGEPLFTAPDAPTLASSRIASANISGKAWGYQATQRESAHSTKPQIAFLPKFNSEPKVKGVASITVSPVSDKMQISEMSQSWPAIYHAKQSERLSAIAQRYGLPVEVLAKNNGLKNGAILTAGQNIKMPRNLQVTYNGKPLQTDVSSMLVGTTSVAAFRFLFEQQGGTVSWDSATQTVHAKNGNNEVTLTIGSDQAVVNQKTVMMDLAAFLLSGRTMVPVRLFEKSLHAQVSWDPSTGRMFMAMAN